MHFIYKIICGHMFSILLAIYLGRQLLGHMVTLCFTLRNCQIVSQVAVAFYTFTSNV